ncbi:MAG: copper-binding protein [Gammaproteobacteria bacterium]|nr:copper-binding protein [Gammaproteobacteria bacterium]
MSGMDMQNKPMTNQTQEKIHHAIGVVKKVDMVNNRVTIAHEPVASLHWPAMTMSFAVKDKKLFDQLTEGKKVEFDIVQTGGVATIVSVK